MTWPHWIDELKERYLADEGNVFVLYGDARPGRGPAQRRWRVDGESFDTASLLVQFLRRTREIVAVLRPAPLPSRLEFSDMSDRTRFENLVKAYDLIQGRTLPLVETDPLQALGRIWRALSTTGTAQGYIVTEAERLLPGHRKRLDPIPGAPELVSWPTHEVLTRSNNLLVFLVPELSSIRADLADASVCIELGDAPPETADGTTALAHLSDDVPPPPVDPPSAPLSELDPAELRERLQREIGAALIRHPEEHRPSGVPVMEAISRVITAYRPDLWGTLSLSIDPEGAPAVRGPGGDRFLAAWRSDVALDAASGMLLRNLRGPFSEGSPAPLDETAISALTRRVERLLKA